MSEKIRILVILPSLKRAGAEMQTIDMINGLDKNRFEKHLLCFEPELDLADKIDTESVVFHHIPRKAKFDWALAGAISNLILERRIALVYCSLMIALFWGWVGIRRSKINIPLIAALHTTLNRSRRADFFDTLLYQWLLRSCTKVLFVCEAQKQHWEKRYPFLQFNSACIHNGIDTAYFSKEAVSDHESQKWHDRLKITSDNLIIAHVAAFRPEKGHLLLLQAFKRLKMKIANAHLVMAGDGPLRASVADQIKDSGLTNCVHLPGALTDVRPLLACADVSVLASTAVETFSIAMLESLAMQVPVVATDLGGVREAVLPNVTGYVAAPGDMQSLAFALQACLTNPNRLLMGSKGRQHVEQHFTRQIMLNKYAELFNTILNIK